MTYKLRWTIAIIFVLILGVFWGFPVASKLGLKLYCNKYSGLTINETVELKRIYFEPFPKNKDRRLLNESYIFDDNLMLNESLFKKEYVFELREKKKVFFIGPVYLRESKVIRKKDNKVLGKYVSSFAVVSLFKGFDSRRRPVEYCPKERDKNYHYGLLKQVFRIQKVEE